MSSSIQNIQTALQALRKAAVKGKTKKSVLENIDNVSTSAVLLNSSSPSVLTFDKLVSVFRAPLVPLYSNYTEPALNVASAILKAVLSNGVRPCLLEGDNRDFERQSGWERVAQSLLSGVMDFLENNDNERIKTCIAKAFYAPICNFFFFKDKQSNAVIGAPLRCTAYILLSDAATLHHNNQGRLRDQKLLGAHALGSAILQTRDFAALETLLNLFAILLPSSLTPQKRSSYIRDVFSDWGKVVAQFLDGVSTREWDETAAKVIDILASTDISFPQPFDVDEVVVCDNKYPQPEISDRFYIDRASFFVNVQQEDGLYEDLQIRYLSVKEIDIASSGGTTALVSMKLKTAPNIGEQVLSARDELLTLKVEILNSELPRFKEALRHRNLGGTIAPVRRSRVSVCESLDLNENSLEKPVTSQLPSQKAEIVQSFYESDPLQPSSDEEHTVVIDAIISTANPADILSKAGSKTPAEFSRLSSIPKLDATIFGGTDEELSDIDKIASVSIETNAMKSGKIGPGPSSTSEPANVIVLSDGDSVPDVKLTTRSKIGAKKRAQKRIDSDEGAAPAKEESKSGSNKGSTKHATSKTAVTEKESDTISQSQAKSKPGKRVKTTVKHTKDDVLEGRPRRAAAATASAKLAKAFAASEDNNLITLPQGVDDLSLTHSNTRNPGEPEDVLSDAPPSGNLTFLKVSQKSRKMQSAKPPARATVPFETIAPRSSSPTSKISRMKAKNPPAETKSLKGKAQKRKLDQTFKSNEQLSPKKKPHVDIESEKESKISRSGAENDAVVTVTTRVSQKLGYRGRKAKAPVLDKGTADWDKVPAESTVKAHQRGDSPVICAGETSPVKAASKENVMKSQHVSKSVTPTPSKAKGKSQSRTRVPLQTIVHVSNEASQEPEDAASSDDTLQTRTKSHANKKFKSRMHVGTAGKIEKEKASALPSLEDVLLKGAVVKKSEPLQKTAEVGDEMIDDNDNVGGNFDFGQAEDMPFASAMDPNEVRIGHGYLQDEQFGKLTAQDGPHTPSKKLLEPGPMPNVFADKHIEKLVDFDAEVIDLTDEDIKEVLQSLRARRTKKELELGNATRLKELTRVAVDERGCSSDENDAPTVQEVISRPKVKFDEKLRYKSASLESLPVHEFRESPVFGAAGRKHRLREVKPVSRGPTEPVNIKRQESQAKKEPGMEEIINVLDAIQNAVVSNITNKTRAVRSDIRAARDHLVREAVIDLHDMREESVAHYNNLLFLENEYANINRKLNMGFEAVANVNTDICEFVRQTIHTHDRGSLSKKMPLSLFQSGLPSCFAKFT